jgi:Reverse transcriptase (RNA-dependent DNA polymerase)
VKLDLLLDLLWKIGIRGVLLNWFNSYLTNRTQCVRFGCATSISKVVDFGVPQGSVLGPILFLIFINSLCSLPLNGRITAFADDIALLYVDPTEGELSALMQEDLGKLSDWFHAHAMKLSIKTKLMFFNCEPASVHSTIIYHDKDCNMACNDICLTIDKVSSFKYLGVTLDSKLSFKEHVNRLKKGLLLGIRALYWLRKFCPVNILRLIFFSCIQSRLDYAICCWGGIFSSNLLPLIKLQKWAIRIVFSKNKFEHSLPLFRKAKVLPLNRKK